MRCKADGAGRDMPSPGRGGGRNSQELFVSDLWLLVPGLRRHSVVKEKGMRTALAEVTLFDAVCGGNSERPRRAWEVQASFC